MKRWFAIKKKKTLRRSMRIKPAGCIQTEKAVFKPGSLSIKYF